MKTTGKEETTTRQPSAKAPPTNIVPLPVEAMKSYPMATGMSEEDINARIAKVYWIKEELMKDGVHYGYTPRNKNGDRRSSPTGPNPLRLVSSSQILPMVYSTVCSKTR